MRDTLSILKWAGYALIWLAAVSVVVLALTAAVFWAAEFEGEATDLPFLCAILVTLAVWIALLWCRAPLRWLKWPALLIAALFVIQPFLAGVVVMIAMGKFIIQAQGRRNVFARSRLASRTLTASPRGLVERINAGERGTTLVSVMVAMVILMIALSMVTSTFFGASRLTRRAADFTTASNFAEGVMERISSRPFSQIVTAKVTSGLPSLPGAECAVVVRQPQAGLKEVTVTCFWMEKQHARKVAFSTLAAKGARQ